MSGKVCMVTASHRFTQPARSNSLRLNICGLPENCIRKHSKTGRPIAITYMLSTLPVFGPTGVTRYFRKRGIPNRFRAILVEKCIIGTAPQNRNAWRVPCNLGFSIFSLSALHK